MTHTHSHGPVDPGPPRPGFAKILAAIVAGIMLATAIGMVVLWPNDAKLPQGQNPYTGQGVHIVSATVKSVKPFDCGSSGEGPDGLPMVQGNCAKVTATTKAGLASFTLDAGRLKAGISTGEDIKVVSIQRDGQPVSYEFYDFQRGVPLTLLALIFFVVVVAVARWRGLFAIVGIGVTLLALTQFMLPAFLAGESPLPVAVVGSTAIMLAVLYLAHGVSIRTTSALFGTLCGLALTAGFGILASGWTNLTGVGTEDDQTLIAVAPHLQISGVVAATMVVAGLGVLNDVTVTQASAVWELRAAKPAAQARELFTSAMRIGRDHIASSVYTLVFAYAGTAMTILLLISAYQRGLAEMATTEQISQEIVRTLVGAIGLVLAVPITTAFAVGMAPKAATPAARSWDATPPDRGSHRAEIEPSSTR